MQPRGNEYVSKLTRHTKMAPSLRLPAWYHAYDGPDRIMAMASHGQMRKR